MYMREHLSNFRDSLSGLLYGLFLEDNHYLHQIRGVPHERLLYRFPER